MIEILVYKTGNKIKSNFCLAPDGYQATRSDEIIKVIREFKDHDFVFIDKNHGRQDITHERLIRLLEKQEKRPNQPKIDLTKIIKAGGFLKYIKGLSLVAQGEIKRESEDDVW